VRRFDKYELNAIAKAVLGPPLIGAGMFWAAGTTAWAWGWIFTALHEALWIANTIAIVARNRELLAERGKRHADTRRWDTVLVGVFGVAWLVELVVAGLDVRYGWTVAFPLALRGVGAGLTTLGFLLFTWSMVVNRHFEPGVRIQTERGHQVVTAGPYRCVRHPGYVGTIASYFVGMPLLLGSWPAFGAAAVGIGVLVVRTALEDALLRRELAGYAAYATRVRARLMPGVW